MQNGGLLKLGNQWLSITRNIARIPLLEYHVRFDQVEGKKRPNPDVPDRFKRLNNGLWIRGIAGRSAKRYVMDEHKASRSQEHIMCGRIECEILDKLVTNYWTRPHYYVNDPYKQYHVRHNLGPKAPRVDYSRRLKRERQKILMDDSTARKHFYDY